MFFSLTFWSKQTRENLSFESAHDVLLVSVYGYKDESKNLCEPDPPPIRQPEGTETMHKHIRKKVYLRNGNSRKTIYYACPPPPKKKIYTYDIKTYLKWNDFNTGNLRYNYSEILRSDIAKENILRR